jgi:hypothetical protein
VGSIIKPPRIQQHCFCILAGQERRAIALLVVIGSAVMRIYVHEQCFNVTTISSLSRLSIPPRERHVQTEATPHDRREKQIGATSPLGPMGTVPQQPMTIPD